MLIDLALLVAKGFVILAACYGVLLLACAWWADQISARGKDGMP